MTGGTKQQMGEVQLQQPSHAVDGLNNVYKQQLSRYMIEVQSQ